MIVYAVIFYHLWRYRYLLFLDSFEEILQCQKWKIQPYWNSADSRDVNQPHDWLLLYFLVIQYLVSCCTWRIQRKNQNPCKRSKSKELKSTEIEAYQFFNASSPFLYSILSKLKQKQELFFEFNVPIFTSYQNQLYYWIWGSIKLNI